MSKASLVKLRSISFLLPLPFFSPLFFFLLPLSKMPLTCPRNQSSPLCLPPWLNHQSLFIIAYVEQEMTFAESWKYLGADYCRVATSSLPEAQKLVSASHTTCEIPPGVSLRGKKQSWRDRNAWSLLGENLGWYLWGINLQKQADKK